MEDSAVTALESVNEIEEDYEPFAKQEDTASCNNLIPDAYESRIYSDSDDDDFSKMKLSMLLKIMVLSQKKIILLKKNLCI